MFKIFLTSFALLLVSLQATKVFSQSPINDQTWQLTKIDNFDFFNTSNWCNDFCYTKNNWGLEYNDPANLLFNYNPGYLTIMAEKLTTPINYNGVNYYYKSGAISSLSYFLTKYGYFEISAILPQGKGYWPAFWRWSQGPDPSGIPPCTGSFDHWYNEIDYLENGGFTSQYDKIAGGYLYRGSPNCSTNTGGPGLNYDLENGAHTTNEHKYACFWEPSFMTWFFDDMPIYKRFDQTYTPHNAISTVINFAVDNWVDANTIFPAYFQINYLKIWQLQVDCNNQEFFCNTAFNPITYDYKVKKSIQIGGPSCSNPSTINTSSNVNLWATDFILLDLGTTINDNASGGFSINLTECPN